MRSLVANYIQPVFRGVGQVMFQDNWVSGLLFFLGIFVNSPLLACAALAGALAGTYTAMVVKYAAEDIKSGLYGFNGALVAIAVLVFFDLSLITGILLVLGAVVSAFALHHLKNRIAPYTAPFVLTTWAAIALLVFVFQQGLRPGAVVSGDHLEFFNAATKGFGQVMFQDNWVTGLFFLTGIFINSRLKAGYAVYASVLGFLAGWVFLAPFATLNAGLMGYNAILAAIALAGPKKIDFLWVTLAIILSVALQIALMATGIITLTAPFVLATWMVGPLRKIL